MSSEIKGRKPDALKKLRKDMQFILEWAESPLTVGAVAPSSRYLGRLMASYIPKDTDAPVLELGPGTGAVTKAVLTSGLAPERVIALEYSADFCRTLEDKFPQISVVRGDAYDIGTSLPNVQPGTLSAIVSSLPLLTRPPAQRVAFLRHALAYLAPGAPFIQFSYSLAPPVSVKGTDMTVERSQWILRNLPPARVWVYRRPCH